MVLRPCSEGKVVMNEGRGRRCRCRQNSVSLVPLCPREKTTVVFDLTPV